jgi:hypothetical protein
MELQVLEKSEERRKSSLAQSVLWRKLSEEQKINAESLSKFGYDLEFMRNESADKIIIMLNGNNIATINENGDIDTNPDIKIR